MIPKFPNIRSLIGQQTVDCFSCMDSVGARRTLSFILQYPWCILTILCKRSYGELLVVLVTSVSQSSHANWQSGTNRSAVYTKVAKNNARMISLTSKNCDRTQQHRSQNEYGNKHGNFTVTNEAESGTPKRYSCLSKLAKALTQKKYINIKKDNRKEVEKPMISQPFNLVSRLSLKCRPAGDYLGHICQPFQSTPVPTNKPGGSHIRPFISTHLSENETKSALNTETPKGTSPSSSAVFIWKLTGAMFFQRSVVMGKGLHALQYVKSQTWAI